MKKIIILSLLLLLSCGGANNSYTGQIETFVVSSKDYDTTGDVLQYSTVKGKVTSGGKRLSPKTVNGNGYNTSGDNNWVKIGNSQYTTDEVLDDGGAYGDSGNYIFWFDAQGNYHQYYPSGGTYLEICDKPLRVKKTNFSVTINEDN